MSDADDLRVARSGTYVEKWQIAASPETASEVLEIMLHDNDVNIVRAVLQNPNVTTKMLQQLTQTRPEYVSVAARHLNAPPEIVGDELVWHLGPESLNRFLEHVGATDEQRTEFIRQRRIAGENQLRITVADAWQRALDA